MRRGKREVVHLELVLPCFSGWGGVQKVDCENLGLVEVLVDGDW